MMGTSLVEKHVKTKKPLLLFVDRYGDVDGVTTKDHDSDLEDRSDVIMELLDSANNAGPYFQICTVVEGVIQTPNGDIILIDDLPAALADAQSDRKRFYDERAEVYGDNAYPRQNSY